LDYRFIFKPFLVCFSELDLFFMSKIKVS